VTQIQPSLFDQPGPPTPPAGGPGPIRAATDRMSNARVRSLAGILLGFTHPGLAKQAVTAALRAHAVQVAAEALAKLQADSDAAG